jgi:cobalt-zinc-cadmium efflux system membrane fusion protein
MPCALALACAPHEPTDHAGAAAAGPEPWAVTAWGERYELFPEVDPLVAGEVATSHTHVTVLDGFEPLAEGRVAIVLRDPAGVEQVFEQSVAKRPGIFGVDLRPAHPGEFDLIFRVDSRAGAEEIPGGRVRVGTSEAPGGAIANEESAAPFEEIGFLKEQQWKVPFATAWAESGRLAPGVVAPARVIPRPGGDRILSAPAAGRLEAEPWPHPGLSFGRGRTIFRVVPRLDEDISLAEREADVAALEADLATAAARAARLAALAGQGLVPLQEAEIVEGERRAIEAHLAGARSDVDTARRARSGGSVEAGESLAILAPFDGVVADVEVTAGQSVEAGAELGRFVAADRWWLETALPPRLAATLAVGPVDLTLRLPGADPRVLASGAARLAALSPAVDEGSGRIVALLELPESESALRAGQALEIELAAGEPLPGVVASAEAVIDDAGIAVVYLQRTGESFERREVRVQSRQGDRVLLEGVRAGERLVVRGAAAIRRSSLAGAGVGEGHVH